VHGDRDAALQALTIHPLVGSAGPAKALLDELLEAHAAYLPQFR
jgi:6-phospho-beta-glucosidase